MTYNNFKQPSAQSGSMRDYQRAVQNKLKPFLPAMTANQILQNLKACVQHSMLFPYLTAFLQNVYTVRPHRGVHIPAPVAQVVECPLRGTGGHGFDPGPRHTKVVKNGTSCSSLGTQTYGVELGLVDPVSG